MKKIIYLDNASTTKVKKEVVREMEKYFFENYGNPSSNHGLGESARRDIDLAREKIAKEIEAKPWEILFTSGATESNNLALFGLANANPKKKKIVISSIEHSSINEPCKILQKRGYEIAEIGVDEKGFVKLNELEKEIDANTLLVSIIYVNNEIGTIQNIAEIGRICVRKGIVLHSDAVQGFGKEKINVNEMNISLLSAAAHKINGPKGIGFLYIKEGIKIEPMIYGGGQERKLRGGTENVPGIMGFAKALELEKKVDKNKIKKIRDYFIQELKGIGGKVNGAVEERACDNVHVSFSGLNADNAVVHLSEKGIMCSTGSACEEKSKDEKKVLKAIGLNKKEIDGALRFTLNEEISKKNVDYVIEEIARLKKISL